MNRVFADTFFYVALLNRFDQNHARVLDWVKRAADCKLVTTSWVLVETADAFARTPHRVQAANFITALSRSPHTRLVGASETLQARGVELYHSRPDKQWSLTDCISFVVMQDEGLTEALTGDRHFAQAGFVPLLG